MRMKKKRSGALVTERSQNEERAPNSAKSRRKRGGKETKRTGR